MKSVQHHPRRLMRRVLILSAVGLLLGAVGGVLLIRDWWYHRRIHFEGVIVDEQGNQLDGVFVGINYVRQELPWPKERFESDSIQVDGSFSVDVDIGRLDGVALDFGKQGYDHVSGICAAQPRMLGMRIVLYRSFQWDPAGGDSRVGLLDENYWPKVVPVNTQVIVSSVQPRTTKTPVDGTYVLVSEKGEIASVERFYKGSDIGFRTDTLGELCSIPTWVPKGLAQDGRCYEWRLYSTATRLPPASTKPATKGNGKGGTPGWQHPTPP